MTPEVPHRLGEGEAAPLGRRLSRRPGLSLPTGERDLPLLSTATINKLKKGILERRPPRGTTRREASKFYHPRALGWFEAAEGYNLRFRNATYQGKLTAQEEVHLREVYSALKHRRCQKLVKAAPNRIDFLAHAKRANKKLTSNSKQ